MEPEKRRGGLLNRSLHLFDYTPMGQEDGSSLENFRT